MNRLCRTSGEGEPSLVELPNGDVWLPPDGPAAGRLFRRHLGHVVEVLDGGRVRRVGAALAPAAPWLRADGPLCMVIERALLDGDEAFAQADGSAALPGPAAPVAATITPVSAAARNEASAAPGLLGRMVALLHRRDPAAPWRDTMPHLG